MTHAYHPTAIKPEDRGWLESGWFRRSLGPLLIAALVVVVIALLVIFSSPSAWHLFGIGRGLVTPELYPYTALLIILATTFGQFIGWVAGSALLVYVWHRLLATAVTFRIVQVAMTLVYAGLAVLPTFFYHFIFGRPLAGLPQSGVSAWLRQHAPGAYGFLIVGHPVVDWFIIPLAIAVLAILWVCGERTMRQRGLQTVWLCLILATSFVVALSLAIHSTLLHIRMGG